MLTDPSRASTPSRSRLDAAAQTRQYKNYNVSIMIPLADALAPLAPGRGRYDRRKSPSERRAEQLARLVAATAASVSRHRRDRVRVSHVVRQAQLGRNTFYALFRDIDEALARTEQHAQELLRRCIDDELTGACTPTERLRAIVRGWLHLLARAPDFSRTVLQAPSPTHGSALSCAGEAMRELLRSALEAAPRDAVLSAAPDELRLLAAAALLEAFGRRYLDRNGEQAAICAVVVDLLLRLLR
jgi:AcrR family transcriptional regulator